MSTVTRCDTRRQEVQHVAAQNHTFRKKKSCCPGEGWRREETLIHVEKEENVREKKNSLMIQLWKSFTEFGCWQFLWNQKKDVSGRESWERHSGNSQLPGLSETGCSLLFFLFSLCIYTRYYYITCRQHAAFLSCTTMSNNCDLLVFLLCVGCSSAN